MNHRRRFLATGLAAGIGALALHRTAFAHGEMGHAAKADVETPREQQAWGIAGDEKAVSWTIPFVMTDEMRFVPDHFEVGLGEIVRITLENRGAVMHEMVIGTPQT